MADPISLAAVAGLIFAGRALSNKSQPEPIVEQVTQAPQPPIDDVPQFVENNFEPRVEVASKTEMASFADIGRQQRSGLDARPSASRSLLIWTIG